MFIRTKKCVKYCTKTIGDTIKTIGDSPFSVEEQAEINGNYISSHNIHVAIQGIRANLQLPKNMYIKLRNTPSLFYYFIT